MVALHRRHFGRGPGAAKSYVVDDLVVCILTDVYTQVERTLIEAGKIDHVRATRQLHSTALGDDYRAAVERSTGRKVIALVSSVHVDPDMAFEVFVLDSSADDGQPEASLKTSTE